MTRHPRDRPPTPTDLLSAFTELLALRVPIGQEREKQVRGSIAARAAAWKGRMKSGMETKGERLSSDSDNTFFYIAGNTTRGVPYGTTWEELGEQPPSFDDE